VFVAGTALLGALVAVLDWVYKIGWLKFSFVPPLTFLKFDALGIPMMLSYLLFGILSGTITSLVGWFSISFRSPFSGFMKFAAEFSTMIGVYIVLRARSFSNVWLKIAALISGVLMRGIVMAMVNVLLLPIFTTTTQEFVLAWIHFIFAFNVIQGVISVFGGFLIYEAIVLRLPSLRSSDNK
jgi:riboflavin transporter FmnP